jgi:hypothetical protein
VGVLVICILYSDVFLTLTEFFLCFFLSCKATARVKLAKTGHGPHSSKLVVICVVLLLFLLFYVLFVCKCVLPPGDNPIAVNKYIKSSDPEPDESNTHMLLYFFTINFNIILISLP